MKNDRYEEGRFSDSGAGMGTVTEEMVRQRAAELAFISGRSRDNILEADLSQARRELLGQDRPLRPSHPEEELSEEERWTGNPESTGDRVQAIPAPDEQTFAEKLVEEGLADAEHDQMLQATKEALRRDTDT